MTKAHLTRFAYGPMGTFGVLSISHEGGIPGSAWFTVECPWLDNRVGESCIPEGTYRMTREDALTKKGAEWLLHNVLGRSAILIHVANTIDDIRGCIGPGKRLGYVKGKWAVVASTQATAEFNAIMRRERESEITVSFEPGAWRTREWGGRM